MTATQSEAEAPSVYKPDLCYRCGGQMGAFSLKSTWQMRIDGALHAVDVFAVPCKKCLSCDVCVLDGTSDEAVQWCVQQYLAAKGLNTRWHKMQRWFRRRLLRVRDRWNLWVYKTFYKGQTNVE